MDEYKYQEEYNLFAEASRAAQKACDDMLAKNPGVWFPCGFSWVKIKPARGKFVSMLKDKGIGSTDSFEGGYVIYNPSCNSTQWMDAKMAGSRAFAQILSAKGIKAIAVERID